MKIYKVYKHSSALEIESVRVERRFLVVETVVKWPVLLPLNLDMSGLTPNL